IAFERVVAALQLKAKWLRSKALQNAAETLERQGMIEGTDDLEWVRIPILLFHQYVWSYLDVDAAIREFRSVRTHVTRRTARPGEESKRDEPH
ncbi:MAG: hypothetical protein M1546_24515, partial [Chloroflexi bacterium]|nr:hypothetical protein [Chloroflexota bacterium]